MPDPDPTSSDHPQSVPQSVPLSVPQSGRPGPRTRALRRRRRRRRYAVLAGVLLVVVAVEVALLTRGPGGEATPSVGPPNPSATPLAGVDVSGLPVSRGAFCGNLVETDVRRALGGPVTGTAHYTVGERALLAPALRDLSQEYDCTYLGAAGAQARAWVFGQPVTARTARGLVRDSRATPRCATVGAGPGFGNPSVTTRCRVRTSPGGTRAVAVTMRGLFGDAWLSCELTLPAASGDVVTRAQRWCVRVAAGAAGPVG